MSDKNKKKNKETKSPGPGSLLKQARNNKKLSIEDVSSRLRLGKHVIEALENDRYEQLPAPIFVRGYLKSFAAFVGVDAQQVITHYDQQMGQVNTSISLGTAHVVPPSLTAIKDRKKKWIPVAITSLLVSLVFIVWMLVDSDTPETLPQAASPVANEVVSHADTALPTTETETAMAPAENEVPAEPVPEVPDAQPEAVNTEKEPVETSDSAPVEEPAVVETEQNNVKPQLDQLVLEFNGDSWVDVSDATGKRLIYRMLKSGEQRSISGTPPFKLTLGNAPEINLIRNGETVDLSPYTRGKVAKFRLGKINE